MHLARDELDGQRFPANRHSLILDRLVSCQSQDQPAFLSFRLLPEQSGQPRGVGLSQPAHDCVGTVLHPQQFCPLWCIGVESWCCAIQDWIHPVRRSRLGTHRCAGSDKDAGEDECAVHRRVSARPCGRIGEKEEGKKMNETRLPHARQPRQV